MSLQLGDYVVPDPNPAQHVLVDDLPLPHRHPWSEAGYDLSGTCLMRCAIAGPSVAIAFHAWRTDPLLIDGCLIEGNDASIVAYGGSMMVRGSLFHVGSQPRGQRQPLSKLFEFPDLFPAMLAPPEWFEAAAQRLSPWARDTRFVDVAGRGVDIFVADPLIRFVTEGGVTAPEAIAPTAMTLVQCESQSTQFLGSYRHRSASTEPIPGMEPRRRFNLRCGSTVLESVHHTNIQGHLATASMEWIGPGWGERAPAFILVGSEVYGPRLGGMVDGRVIPPDPPEGGMVVVGSDSHAVADLGTRCDTFPHRSPLVLWDVLAPGNRYRPLEMLMRTGFRIGTLPLWMHPEWLRVL